MEIIAASKDADSCFTYSKNFFIPLKAKASIFE